MRRPGELAWACFRTTVIFGQAQRDPRTQEGAALRATGYVLGPPVKPNNDDHERPEDDSEKPQRMTGEMVFTIRRAANSDEIAACAALCERVTAAAFPWRPAGYHSAAGFCGS